MHLWKMNLKLSCKLLSFHQVLCSTGFLNRSYEKNEKQLSSVLPPRSVQCWSGTVGASPLAECPNLVKEGLGVDTARRRLLEGWLSFPLRS